MNRNLSSTTIKSIFAFSGNQCAAPDCTQKLAFQQPESSTNHVIGKICHINALSDEGPRANPALSEEQRNALENLILLCPNHHDIVDNDPDRFTADLLHKWKKDHEALIETKVITDVSEHETKFPQNLVDQEIESELSKLQQGRFFFEFNSKSVALSLGERLVDRELSGGNAKLRQRALSWCSRVLSITELLPNAKEFYDVAESLGESTTELQIAAAFLASVNGDHQAVVSALADIDSAEARGALFTLTSNKENVESAIDWLNREDLSIADLDSDGKVVLLTGLLDLFHYDQASENAAKLKDTDFEMSPSLHYVAAMCYLVSGVTEERLRHSIRFNVPIGASRFPFSDTHEALENRRKAEYHFNEGANFAMRLGCEQIADFMHKYSLWLQLRDPEKKEEARQNLSAKLTEDNRLRFIPLALEFGIDLDFETVEIEIEQQVLLQGHSTAETALARFSLALTHNTPEEAVAYISQHHDELIEWTVKLNLASIEIDLIAQTGRLESARSRLEEFAKMGLSSSECADLARIIAQRNSDNPVEVLIDQYEKSKNVSDLEILVEELSKGEICPELSKYARKLYRKTESLRSVVLFCRALMRKDSFDEVVGFLNSNSEFLKQSDDLRFMLSFALYHEGQFKEARSEIAKTQDSFDHPNYWDLIVRIEIALGNWEELIDIIAEEVKQIERRDPRRLIENAQLALSIGSPFARRFLKSATEKGKMDPNALASAYYLAINAGWEDEVVYGWLESAIKLSDDEGPLYSKTLKDFLDYKHIWDRQLDETYRKLTRAEIPVFGAAKLTNRTLVDLFLKPALVNLQRQNTNEYTVIPAYSGARGIQELSLSKNVVALDGNALITLVFLGLLDLALSCIESIVIPHSTMLWLFEEQEKTNFHQPTRIKQAKEFQQLLAAGYMEEFFPTIEAPEELAKLIGDELAVFLAESVYQQEKQESQFLVVHSNPILTVESLMQKEADLSEYAPVLISFEPIVEKLRKEGQLTLSEKRRVLSILSEVENPWPTPPCIEDNAVLLLDGLAVHYFQRAGLLQKIQHVGLRVHVSKRAIDEANALIAYEDSATASNELLESVRHSLKRAVDNGSLTFGRANRTEKNDHLQIAYHPTVAVIDLAKTVNAIVLDDRSLNQLLNVDLESGGGYTPISNTLDLLYTMLNENVLTYDQWSEAMTKLRGGGFYFVPVSYEELNLYLSFAEIKHGRLEETAELKCIREYFLVDQLADWLQLPKERFWLESTTDNLVSAIKNQWIPTIDVESAVARSNWVYGVLKALIDRIVAHNNSADFLSFKIQIMKSILFSPVASDGNNESYWKWLDVFIVPALESDDIEAFSMVMQDVEHNIRHYVYTKLETSGIETSDAGYFVSCLYESALKFLPPSVRKYISL